MHQRRRRLQILAQGNALGTGSVKNTQTLKEFAGASCALHSRMNTEAFWKSTELNITSIISGTDACELFQSSSIACCLLTQGVALGWNLRTPSALGVAKPRLGLTCNRCFAAGRR